jgi:succinate dehydrogenase / fumarate reductase cytochrome b subunit
VNVAQVFFLCGLALVLGAVATFTTIVVLSAGRGGRAPGVGLLRGGTDHARGGRAAFLAHRLTGFGIFAFLSLHILDVAVYSVSKHLYDEVQPIYGSPALRVFECVLLFSILFHTGNGLRLVAVDLARLSPTATSFLLRLEIAVVAIAGAAGSALILAPIFR